MVRELGDAFRESGLRHLEFGSETNIERLGDAFRESGLRLLHPG